MFDRFDSLPAPSGPAGPDEPSERMPSPGQAERFVAGRPGGPRGEGAQRSHGAQYSGRPDYSGGPDYSDASQYSDASHYPGGPRNERSGDPMRRGIAGEELSDFGPLGPFVSDPAVTDVFVNGPGGVWVDRGRGAERERVPAVAESQLRELAVRLIALGGRHIDEATPCVDVRLHDGIRVHAVLPPISTGGTLLSIRLPRVDRPSLADLHATGFFSLVPLDTIARLVARRENLLITGAAGTGKTTLLAALLASAAPADRIIAIEDVAELRVAHPHFVSLESRQANLEGAGQLGLERLVREALRMRPDRLVLGECRGGEIRELLAALNTGHDGGAGTLHANSLEDVPARLEALGALAGMSETAIARQTVSAIGTVLHLERKAGSRRLAQIGRFELDPRGRLSMVETANG